MEDNQKVTTNEEKEQRGYAAGVEAAKQGLPVTANPYYHDTPEWRGWNRGWTAGQPSDA